MKTYKCIYANPSGTSYDSTKFVQEAFGIEDAKDTGNGTEFNVGEDKLVQVFESIFSQSRWDKPFYDKVKHLRPLARNKGQDLVTFAETLSLYNTSISAASGMFGERMPIVASFTTDNTDELDGMIAAISDEVKNFTLVASSIATTGEGQYLCQFLFLTSSYKTKALDVLRKVLIEKNPTAGLNRMHVLLSNNTRDGEFKKIAEMINKGIGIPYRAFDEMGRPIQDKPDEIKPLSECIGDNGRIKLHIGIGYENMPEGWRPLDITTTLGKEKGIHPQANGEAAAEGC